MDHPVLKPLGAGLRRVVEKKGEDRLKFQRGNFDFLFLGKRGG